MHIFCLAVSESEFPDFSGYNLIILKTWAEALGCFLMTLAKPERNEIASKCCLTSLLVAPGTASLQSYICDTQLAFNCLPLLCPCRVCRVHS